MSTNRILVTAANGNTGFPTAKTLLELGIPVRAFVRNADNPKALELKQLGAEIFVGDIEDIRDVRRALHGIRRAYFVPVYPNVLFQGETFATAAEEAVLEHVVVMTQWLSSNLHPSSYTKEHWLLDHVFRRLPRVKATLLNPGLFAASYFFTMEPLAQFGMMPDFGSNAPPSNEDIGAVAAHILEDPGKHEGKTYRITGREVLTSQEMAEIIGRVLGRKIKVRDMSEKMIMKVFKAYGYAIRDYSQLRYYIKDAQTGVFAQGGPTDVVKNIVGREADDFETIARRYVEGHPQAGQTIFSKLRAIRNLVKAAFTRAPNLDRYEQEMAFPKFDRMALSGESED